MQNAIYLDIFLVVAIVFLNIYLGFWNKKNSKTIKEIKDNPYFYPLVQQCKHSYSLIGLVLLLFLFVCAWRLMEVFIAFDGYGVSAWVICLIFFLISMMYFNLTAYRAWLIIIFAKKINAYGVDASYAQNKKGA